MPIGSVVLLPHVISEAQKIKPSCILDVGIGYGIYGPAFRQWLDMGVKPYKTIVDGVEGFRQYKSACWDEYNDVVISDIRDFTSQFTYDMIIFSDVIEHLTKEDGLCEIEKLKRTLKNNGVLLIGTPALWIPQTDVHNNEFERHKSLWTVEDFPGFEVILDGSPVLGNRMILVKYTKHEPGT
ncbi:MAG TPA: methyltransferase domain-containing protein [Paludibacteraceae bacterium]|nr:methyltransferase domain-containing protein [Paludibacteraceae bacterium]